MNIENFSNGGLNTLVNQFQSGTSGWMNTADHIALQIFGALAVLEFVWSGATILLRKNDLPDILTGVLFKVLSLSFFYTLIIEAPTWIPDIIQSFWDIGGQISGQAIQSPNAILQSGIQMGASLINSTMNAVSGWHPASSFILSVAAGIAAILILIGMLILALQLMVTLIEAFIVVGAGAVLLGFMGSRWTSQWGEKYFGYAVSVGIKLMIVELITGLAMSMTDLWAHQLATMQVGLGHIFVPVESMFNIGVGSLIIGALAIMVPSIASSMMNGSPSLSLGNVGAAGAAIAGGVVAAGAGAAMGAASLANSAIGAGKAAGSLASSANTAMGGMKGLGAAFQEGAGAANESGILGLGAGTTGAQLAGGLTGMAGQAMSGMGTAGMHGLKAAGGMVGARIQGVSGRKAQEVSNALGDKAVQGHGETTAGGNFANRVRAQRQGEDPKGNSVGLGAAPDASPNHTGNVGGGSGPSDPNAGAAMGSTTSAGNTEGSTAAGIPNDGVPVRPNDGVPAKGSGDSIGGGGNRKGGFSDENGPRFDTRPDHERAISAFRKIKDDHKPRGFPNDGGGSGAGGPRISHTE
ncbi:P-type conjugative transfer protein TrbL [Acidithiobacillus ferrooxidans]|uniref:P-type conjugative transfer protein TrbL n=1 Tax=Acidithiobacillus ferrooxidans TaxID=920 RepID=A0A2W1KRN3_ACIFR|nr:P-type conjugative transfer protein TrbL [Acidithiobacillus ferrooxidans]MCR1342132.1 P-type conjugative transfer protein TrbL [Acidithiobacillus ferrooxidans]PZD81867.1 P-type conjugative transfer protein TrbL [Acidithiobacillus ferrooxidans]QLK41843.1 P-type conjugative transfer protein TrbL [Acidithiobacillus ferrooxidans]QZT53797.1 P-type conjugative transfer protein TrbL [Acidithiobacillus ferrooxidans]BDB13982.1 P-type conjugative transfer protein TrbL [Acidithiobacillus ferrooxidans]